MESIYIGKQREFFWDDYLIDTDKTTAFHRMIYPIKKEVSFTFDQGKEAVQGISYPCILRDEKGYKLYYVVWKDFNTEIYCCVLESDDGLSWTRPDLQIFPHSELKENNVVLDEGLLDGAFVFYDTAPGCRPEEKYKLIGCGKVQKDDSSTGKGLCCWTSPDGYRFTYSCMITDDGYFDSLNTVHWRDGRYACYYRNFHGFQPGKSSNFAIRDIRVTYSEDFVNWTEPTMITFDDGLDYPLYTNHIIPYERAPHILVGFPTRYCERSTWTPNNDQFVSNQIKHSVMTSQEKRSGLAVTDCIFMCSRDGVLWHRYNEALLTPGYENEHNWVYGDCYPAYNLVDSGRETYYMYAPDRHRSIGFPRPLSRYEIRKDGFACIMADGQERTVVTKPIIFEGKELHLNFSTSAYGYIYVDVLDKKGTPLSEKQSFEVYGDNIDRTIYFEDGTDFSVFAGKSVRLRFRMRDAKLYSFIFAE